MDTDSLLHTLGHEWLYLITIIVVVWLVLTKLAESESAALKIFGPAGRWVQKAAVRRSRRHRAELNAELVALAEKVIPDIAADFNAVKGQLSNVVIRLTEVEIEAAALRAFVIVDERWHFDVALELAQHGNGVTLPARLDWAEFLARYQHGWRPDGDTPPGTS